MFGNMKYPRLWKLVAVLASHTCLSPVLGAPGKSETGGTYAVKAGDTFAKIARAKGIGLGELLKANRISNPNHIIQGQQIVIPGSAKAQKAPPKAIVVKEIPRKKTVATSSPPVKKQLPLVTGTRRREAVNTTVDVSPPPRKDTCIVQSGDSLTRISRRTGTPLSEILRLNKLTATSTIRPGQTLRISGGAGEKALVASAPKNTKTAAPVEKNPVIPAQAKAYRGPAPVEDAPARTAQTGLATHVVGSGETFSSIRRAYGVTQTQLAKANPGVDPHRLRAGQSLMIPGQPLKQPEAKTLVVRADGRVLAQRHDPLQTAGDAPVSVERTRTGYLVEDGENIEQIAQRFNTSDREIRRLNRMGDSDDVYPGRYILVPFIRQATTAGTYGGHDA
jgi:membrane-bound lytic murein transglycosylase D